MTKTKNVQKAKKNLPGQHKSKTPPPFKKSKPVFSPAQKSEMGKSTGVSRTPQAERQHTKGISTPNAGKVKPSTPKSAPQPKRKKLSQEIDEELSDEDFEQLLVGVKDKEKKRTLKKLIIKKGGSGEEEEESDSEADDDDEDIDDDSDDEMDADGSDDEEDSEDEEEDDESEEEPSPPPKKEKSKKEKQTKVQKNDKSQSKKESSPSPKKENTKKEKQAKAHQNGQTKKELPVEVESTDLKHKAELNKRTLHVRNLGPNATEEKVMELSKDILSCSIRMSYKHSKRSRGYSYLTFESEKIAKKNFKLLQNKKVDDREIHVSFMEEAKTTENLDSKKLYITGFERNTKFDKLKTLFPKAQAIHLPRRNHGKKNIGYAFAFFETEADAAEAHQQTHGKVHDGRTLVVLFAKQSHHEAVEKRKRSSEEDTKSASPTKKLKVDKKTAKKAKKVVEEEEEEEMDSDDDDDDEMDSNDDDEEAGDDDEEDGDDDDGDSDDDDDSD